MTLGKSVVVKNNVSFEDNIAAYTEGGLFSGADVYSNGGGGLSVRK